MLLLHSLVPEQLHFFASALEDLESVAERQRFENIRDFHDWSGHFVLEGGKAQIHLDIVLSEQRVVLLEFKFLVQIVALLGQIFVFRGVSGVLADSWRRPGLWSYVFKGLFVVVVVAESTHSLERVIELHLDLAHHVACLQSDDIHEFWRAVAETSPALDGFVFAVLERAKPASVKCLDILQRHSRSAMVFEHF